MTTERTKAFSDGVIAIIITIMVLELAAPTGEGWHDLLALWPKVVVYLASFGYVGIYWINHHHMFDRAVRVTGGVLWANLVLLFLLSLFPLATAWVGDSRFAPVPVSFYAIVTLLTAVAVAVLVQLLVRANPETHRHATGITSMGRMWASMGIYVVAAMLPLLAGHAGAICAAVLLVLAAAVWVAPHRRRAVPGATAPEASSPRGVTEEPERAAVTPPPDA